eukprot:CAMPEP_0203662910 /NCGR_PEP_ID=MMETSP0090-20130426/706_1 /ASSEMBLY_ACC=CAM_ASM_001088 /TAXON_ID=426623 /ORGANISM="Chaetoceros affinis, Strain CCMP159" /LENGTH=109 /DNA_ID=CAMNT_0050525755 /DNA_START=89 /DNA_END=416 /DNA_ORIENTATION=+
MVEVEELPLLKTPTNATAKSADLQKDLLLPVTVLKDDDDDGQDEDKSDHCNNVSYCFGIHGIRVLLQQANLRVRPRSARAMVRPSQLSRAGRRRTMIVLVLVLRHLHRP